MKLKLTGIGTVRGTVRITLKKSDDVFITENYFSNGHVLIAKNCISELEIPSGWRSSKLTANDMKRWELDGTVPEGYTGPDLKKVIPVEIEDRFPVVSTNISYTNPNGEVFDLFCKDFRPVAVAKEYSMLLSLGSSVTQSQDDNSSILVKDDTGEFIALVMPLVSSAAVELLDKICRYYNLSLI